MAEINYIWKGAPSSIDVFSDGTDPQLIFSGPVAPGKAIETPLDPTNEFVASLLAFRLIEAAPIDVLPAEVVPAEVLAPEETEAAQAIVETGRRSRNSVTKESV